MARATCDGILFAKLLVAAVFTFSSVCLAQEAEPPAQLQFLEGAESSVLAVGYGAGGKTIAGATAQGKIFYWDTADNRLIAQLLGYSGPVLSAATSPDGFQLATGGRDGLVKVFDIPTTHPLGTITGLAGLPTSVVVSADGTLILTGDQSKAIRLWNGTNQQNIRNFAATESVVDIAMDTNQRNVFAISVDGAVQGWNLDNGQATGRVLTVASNAVAAHPDGYSVATTGKDGVLRIIQWPPLPPRNVVQQGGAVVALAISADDKLIVSGSHDQTVRSFNAETGAAIHTLAGHVGQSTSTAISNDVTLIASGNNTGTIRFWQAEDGAARGTLDGHVGPVRSLAFHPTLPQIASAGEDGTLRVWNAPQSSLPLTGHSMPVSAVSISSDGKTAATAAADQTLRLWNLADGKQSWVTPALGQPLQRVAFAPQDGQLATGDATGTLRLHNTTDGAVEFTRGAHTTAITGLAYDPEAKRLVTSGLDGLVKLWSLPLIAPQTLDKYTSGATSLEFTDAKQLALSTPDGTIHVGDKSFKLDESATVLAISPDGKLLAAGTGTGNVKVRDIATGAEAFQLTGHQGSVNAIAFHPKEAKIATAAADGSIGVWDIPKAVPEAPLDEPLLIWAGHASGVTSLVYTPDGAALVSGGGDFAVRRWNAVDGKPIRAMTHAGVVTALAITKKGTQVISASSDKTVRVWNLSNGAQVASLAVPTPVQRMAVSGDETRVVTSGDDNVIRVWDLASGRELERFVGHTAAIQALDFSPDNKTVASASADKTVRKWTIGVERLIVADVAKIHTMALTPDGRHIVTGGEDKLVKQWDLAGKLVRQFAGAAAPVRCLSIRADGKQVAGGGDPGATQANLFVWDLANGKVLKTLATGAGVTAAIFNGEGKIAVAGADKHLRVFSPEDGLLLQDWIAANVLSDIAIGPDHTTILSACADNNSHVFHYSLVELFTGHVGAAAGIAFTPDGKRLISCGADKTIRLWNRGDGKLLSQFVGSTAAVNGLSLSEDGKRLVAGGDDKIVRVWDVPGGDGKPAAQLKTTTSFTHPAIVRSVSMTADGNTIAAAGDDFVIRLWDVATGKEREQFTGHSAAIHAVQLSSDGSTVVSGGADNFTRQFFPAVIATVAADKADLRSVSFSGNGSTVFTGGSENVARQWSIRRRVVEVPAKDPAAVEPDPAAAPDPAAGADPAAPLGDWARDSLQLVREFVGATKALTAVAASGNDKYLLVASEDGQLRLYDATDGANLATAKPPTPTNSIAISDSGRTVIAAGADKIIRNYQLLQADDAWQLTPFHDLLGHTEAVVDVALAQSTSALVSVAGDSTIQRWIAASAYPRKSFSGHAGPVYGLSWRADGGLLASASGDKTVRVWDTKKDELRFTCAGHEGQVNGVGFHPAGNELASCSADRTIRIWSAELPPDPPAAGTAVPAKEPDPEAEKKPAPGEQIGIIQDGIEDILYSLTYSRDGSYLLAGGMSKLWRQWQRGGEKPLQPLRDFALHNHPIFGVVASPSNQRFTTFDTSGKLCVWTMSNGALAFHQQLPTTIGYGVAYSPNSEEMVAATRDNRVMRILIPPHAR